MWWIVVLPIYFLSFALFRTIYKEKTKLIVSLYIIGLILIISFGIKREQTRPPSKDEMSEMLNKTISNINQPPELQKLKDIASSNSNYDFSSAS